MLLKIEAFEVLAAIRRFLKIKPDIFIYSAPLVNRFRIKADTRYYRKIIKNKV